MISKIEYGEFTIRNIYEKFKSDKNSLKQKVTCDFFENDGEKRLIRTDDNGSFYFRNYEKRREIKAFTLPKYLNSERIRQRILDVIEEEMGKGGGNE